MINNPEFSPLDKKYFKLMLVRRILFSVILAVALVIFFLMNDDKEIPTFIPIVTAGVLALFMLLYISLTKIVFRNKMYLMNNAYLSYKKGILLKHLTAVPFSRIQHIEIDEGPFERFFKLSTMSIYTAGDSGKDLKISGLKKEKAQEIKELITAYIKDE